MSLSIRIGLISAVTYIFIELVLLLMGHNHNRTVMLLMLGANSLILLVGVALSILVNFNRNKTGGLSMIVDLKVGITTAAVYAISVSTFLLLYFSVLDPSYPEMRRDAMMEGMQQKEAVEELKKQMAANPDNYQGKSAEDIQEMNMNNVQHILSPTTIFPISLFSLLMLGMIYAFFVMAFNRMILAKL